ncbi:POK9 protein, partial [Sylvia atricapilla]|nr:POK9 protein [Sylvia atricapilla]
AEKRETQREQQPRRNTSSSCNAIQQLRPATAGSLGLDLAAAVEVTLMTPHPQTVPTEIFGPIIIEGNQVGGLILGRSSASISGLFILPGLLDADYSGKIMIMVHTPFPPLKIAKGQRLAQVVPLPQLAKALPPIQPTPRGKKGFGSTGGLVLLTVDLLSRPKRQLQLRFKDKTVELTRLLDTGTNSSIISPDYWPQNWPLLASSTTVTGIGGMTLASKTPTLVVTMNEKTLQTIFSVTMLPHTVQCLVGRDILSQMGLVL